MDGSGGCCIDRYATGGVYDVSKVDRIMLRFRPIAPKPATSGSLSGGSTPENSGSCGKNGRGKRRYVRDVNSISKRNNNKRKKASEPVRGTISGGSVSGAETVVTLPLLPETPDRKDSPARGSLSDHSDLSSTPKKAQNEPIWLNFGKNDNDNDAHNCRTLSVVGSKTAGVDLTAVLSPKTVVRLVGSVVLVECVTDTWVEGYGLGRTDQERLRNLERDTCPGFISDGLNRVVRTNGAYREMVDPDGGGDVVVWLVVKEGVPITYPAFTCRVRLQYTCGKERSSLTVPCDVWRMDGGGFAWRLDVKAALSLGR